MKAYRKIIDRNGDSRISQREFIRAFIRPLSKRYLCGRPTAPPRKCSARRLRRTKKIIVKGFKAMFCAYKKKFPLLSAKTFVNKYFKKYNSRGSLKSGALYKVVEKKLPSKLKLLRWQLRSLR